MNPPIVAIPPSYQILHEPMISYAHQAEPHGTRYAAMKNSTIPVWAVDVQDYVPPVYLSPAQKFDQKVDEFRAALKSEGLYFASELAVLLQAVEDLCDSARADGYNDGRSDGYNEGFDAGDRE